MATEMLGAEVSMTIGAAELELPKCISDTELNGVEVVRAVSAKETAVVEISELLTLLTKSRRCWSTGGFHRRRGDVERVALMVSPLLSLVMDEELMNPWRWSRWRRLSLARRYR